MLFMATSDVTFSPRPADFSGFVRAHEGHIVDGSGRRLLLRGIGLGNWLLPEGYMWKLSPGANSPREIESLFERLVGAADASHFWKAFRETFIREADIEAIAASGFDHIRLPINARLVQTEAGEPIEAGLALIDNAIEWCRKHRLWVLLDLHGAPGGQTGTNIDDSPNNLPELFMVDAYRQRTIALWRLLAARYRHETVVMGYDLLNEPLPDEWQHKYADQLVALYRDLTLAIREIDPDHLLMYEGSHWATNWDIFDQVWDSNSALQFHKYWSAPDTESIRKFIDTGIRLGLPIYMGEGGENNIEWLYAAFRLYESHGIGWNLWTWKKIETATSPVSIAAPEGWNELVRYANEGGEPVAAAATNHVLVALIDAMRMENCRWNTDVLRAVMGHRPRTIPAWAFGYRGRGESWAVADGKPMPGLRTGDAVTIRYADGKRRAKPDFNQTIGQDYLPQQRMVVGLKRGDWLEYEIEGLNRTCRATVRDIKGRPAAVEQLITPRGIRLTATEDVFVGSLHFDQDE